jgi:calcineurin-like phosphoesterase family protein
MFKALYSDPHIGHENIIKYCNRPFNNIQEMNDTLINNYNSVINKNDCVLWLGDCFFKGDSEKYQYILKNMNGYKFLISGNHDQGDSSMSSMGFELVMKEAVINIKGIICRVNHYPYDATQGFPDKFAAKRPRKNPGEILLHGHNHSITKITSKQSINVGVDAWNYFPALYNDVANLVLELNSQLNIF